jgi:hypothetical protein
LIGLDLAKPVGQSKQIQLFRQWINGLYRHAHSFG